MSTPLSDDKTWVGRAIDQYQIVSLIGAGGMGVVYRARDTRLGRDVALKVLPEEFADNAERVAIEPAKPQRPVSLRDRLIVGLQARLKSEVAFVDLVVLRVRLGQLPQRVVDETFFWARDRASVPRSGRTRRPIIYFQPAMVARAKRLRVDL